ncbi:DUF2249 domain-containing protein [Miltoncostaea oceani]|jgi:uncharacterized protein (DUF2249 family)|uniref:DUF2249 domain-containing protein n=1 Tax=Miltoncostaea oceani TaxID=2843216 RepID=UPI001C3D256D|nr:DUF2249 domain-containing protein [Miltoncostaea oceani]
MAASPTTVIDVREMVPRDRHPTIFTTFEALSPGQAMELVNDHDPQPLRRQFETRLPGSYTWDYLEEGPEVWRVRIGKR